MMDASSQRHYALTLILVFLIALQLYSLTLAPGLLWGGGDFATFQTAAYTGDVEIERGVFSHPLWVLLAHPFTKLPFRDIAWRANFASAVFASLSLVIFFDIAHRQTKALIPATLGTLSLAVSHTFWTYAVMPKVYSLNVLLAMGCLWLLLQWRRGEEARFLYLFAFLYGLSFLNHLVMVVLAPGFLAFIWMQCAKIHPTSQRFKSVTGALVAYLAGLSPLLFLFAGTGNAVSVSQVVGNFADAMGSIFTNPGNIALAAAWGVPLFVYQFPLTCLVGVLGLARLVRSDRPFALLLILSLVGVAGFLVIAAEPSAGGVYVWNLHYYLLGYAFFAFGIAAGFADLLKTRVGSQGRALALAILLSVVVPVVTYSVAPAIAPLVWRDVPDFRPIAGRDNFVYALSPWKQNEDGARRFGESVLDALPQDSVLVADYSIWAVIRYLQVVEGRRQDVKLVRLPGESEQLPLLLDYRDRPDLFLADTCRYYAIQQIETQFEIISHRPVYRLRYKGGT
ncbi:MAG: DUF2723 domain-containing protein [Anaerolineales bacterium]|nr:DUF2723 domain-containing protein [Anaerolineales bacterium]